MLKCFRPLLKIALRVGRLVKYSLNSNSKKIIRVSAEQSLKLIRCCHVHCIVYNKKIKPYWSENLNRLNKISRQKFKKWVSEGRPRGMQSCELCILQKSQICIQKRKQKAARRTEEQEFDEISNASEIDHVKFWRYVNRKRGNRRKRKCSVEI